MDRLRSLLDINRISRISKVLGRDVSGEEGVDERWMKVFYGGFDIFKEWKIVDC